MFDPENLENEIFQLVTLTPLRREEILALLKRVEGRVKAIPVVKVKPAP
jgi:hypothetical protein